MTTRVDDHKRKYSERGRLNPMISTQRAGSPTSSDPSSWTSVRCVRDPLGLNRLVSSASVPCFIIIDTDHPWVGLVETDSPLITFATFPFMDVDALSCVPRPRTFPPVSYHSTGGKLSYTPSFLPTGIEWYSFILSRSTSARLGQWKRLYLTTSRNQTHRPPTTDTSVYIVNGQGYRIDHPNHSPRHISKIKHGVLETRSDTPPPQPPRFLHDIQLRRIFTPSLSPTCCRPSSPTYP